MNLLKVHLSSLPSDLVVALQTEFQKLHQQYFLGKWEPAQLNGGRFSEAVLRIIEYKDTNKFTPVGTQLSRKQIINSVAQNTLLPKSLRFQIPILAELVMDFRNDRNVGHLGIIDVNEMDSSFVLNASNWIVAELIRIETQMKPAEAQAEIKKIIERKVPIIEEIGGRLKCLNPKLDAKTKAVVFCYQKYPAAISLDCLVDWTEYTNKGVLRKKLQGLNKASIIDFRNDWAQLTRKGIDWVEKNVSFELEV
ncbi:MAG: hypothetical protein RLZZ70_23 [Candidatus Parcubacteria bacterium]|jgi:hypothetical protein